MAISRAQLVKELEPGLNALFGLEYNTYDQEHKEIYSVESSDRAFEEEVMLSGFAEAPTKAEGAGVAYDQAQEVYTARYTNETVALAFSLTEEAIEDNLYDKLSARYTKALARSMATTKQIKGAAILNGAFTTSLGGDGVALCATDHPTLTGPDLRNELTVAADLTEASLEQALIDIASFTDERGLKIAVQGTKLILPKELQFTADRILKSTLRVGTADNDINAVRNMGMVPQGYAVNHYLTDLTAWFIITDAPNGMKMFDRCFTSTGFEGEFNTGQHALKARERYSFGLVTRVVSSAHPVLIKEL
jgi:hypothetical protein